MMFRCVSCQVIVYDVAYTLGCFPVFIYIYFYLLLFWAADSGSCLVRHSMLDPWWGAVN